MNLNGILECNQTKGFGSDIENVKRDIYSSVLLFKHQLSSHFQYELSFRKEITANYKSPFLYSFGTKYMVNKNYLLRANASRNFRIPTLNDLYWVGAGNKNLKPENANQFEIGQEIKIKNLSISNSVYIIYLKDMIQWTPANGSFWTPNNIKNVTSKGLETNLNWKKNHQLHSIELNANYAYTISEDNVTKQQLIYVPFNKLNASICYGFKNASINAQFLYNGKVFTTSDNAYELNAFKIANLGFDYLISRNNNIKLGCNIRNIFNENYQSVASRPMPGRNYNLHLTFKF
jgi:iron complex outermembrane receptor protein